MIDSLSIPFFFKKKNIIFQSKGTIFEILSIEKRASIETTGNYFRVVRKCLETQRKLSLIIGSMHYNVGRLRIRSRRRIRHAKLQSKLSRGKNDFQSTLQKYYWASKNIISKFKVNTFIAQIEPFDLNPSKKQLKAFIIR